MAITLKQPTLTHFNVGIKELYDNINNVVKSKKYNSYIEAVKSINKYVLDEELATEYKTSSSVSIDTETENDIDTDTYTDTIPYLSDSTTNNLIRVNTTIYNKNLVRDHMVLFKFINPHFNNDIVYCCNYKNEDFNYCITKFNMFFCSNKPCLLMDIAPFTLEQYYILLDNIGYKS